MAYTALQLITRSFYLSQIVARDLQTPSGSEIEDGLYLLNALLDVKSSDLSLIPYFQEYDLPAVAGQEKYHIPNLLYIDSMTFNIGTVRYPMQEKLRKDYFGSGRVDNINSLPFTYHPERTLGGMDVYLYFLPSDAFILKIWGKFGLTDVTLNTDLSTIYDLFYIEYLRYALAEYLCCEFAVNFPEQCARKFQEIRKKLLYTSPPDLTMIKTNYFNDNKAYDWQTVNLSVGWLPF